MTESILQIFFQISQIPRPSRHESGIRDWLMERSRSNRWECRTDHALNVLMDIPPTNGMRHAPPVMLQSHSDMVAERDPLSSHNFLTDPIPCYRDGDWVRSRGTTLGADNGIGMAIALGIAESTQSAHPPLQLLFTANEEAGMTGIRGLDPSWLSSPYCINLDTSSEKGFTVGSAGGASLSVAFPLHYEEASPELSWFKILVSGLRGGHSGGTATRDRLSALTVLWDVLGSFMPRKDICIQEIISEHARNAVSSHAEMTVSLPGDCRGMLEQIIHLTEKQFRTTWRDEHNLVITLEPYTPDSYRILSRSRQEALYELGKAMPQGVCAMDSENEHLPLLSANWPHIVCSGSKASLGISIRGATADRIHGLITTLTGAAESLGSVVTKLGEHPPWPERKGSKLLSCAIDSYQHVEQRPPLCRSIHAGLECGWMHQAAPDMDIISMGAWIEEAHTPQERLRISSVERTVSVVEDIFTCLASRHGK